MAYWAKSAPQITIARHTMDLQNIWQKFLIIYPKIFTQNEQQLISKAIEYHDLGKLNALFQRKIQNNKIRIEDEMPHGFFSCAYFFSQDIKKEINKDEALKTDIRILMTAIYNHHTRDDFCNTEKLKDYINRYLPEIYIDEITNKEYKMMDNSAKFLKYIIPGLRNRIDGGKPIKAEILLKYIVIKGMLNRIDYAASGDMKELEITPPAIDFLTKKIINQLKEKNWQLRPVQKYMQQHKDDNLVVIASTGCGKTEAALLWLDGYKTFYTLPLKVSINAIHDRICDDYGYDKEKITLLHSGLFSYYLEQNSDKEKIEVIEETLERQNKARLLSYPLTICTVDQLFYFVFKAAGTEMIPATLKYSRIIIDEIQMYSPDILAYILCGLKTITELGGKFAIITATFPPILQEIMREEKIKFIPPQEKYFVKECSERHKIKCINSEFDYEKIFTMGQQQKVLVLCNTVKKAQDTYNKLKSYNDEFEEKVIIKLLHSRFVRKDRAALERAIKEDAKSDKPIIWISTQIVEASLDISYDVLFTEMCPADSLLQRMGRCCRTEKYEDKYPDGQINVYIYNTGNGIGEKSVYKFTEINDNSWQLLQQYDGEIFTEKEKFKYIDAVYAVDSLKNSQYYLQIKKNLQTLKKLLYNSINQEQARKLFRNIQSVSILPDALLTDNTDLESAIDSLEKSRKMTLPENMLLEEKIRQYTVDIPANTLFNNSRYIDKCLLNNSKKLNIHKAWCKYDFSEADNTGIGIEIDKPEDENNII
ncbi:CRISPR-associated helicase Cas3' [Pectinatus brassicae]|uniref:CRISPR-associated endonuclease/helicase Cas3 n=1 Tax=Pectinatus brassicae TaxID=862415 RepID=A0A840UIS7_9FIRM|nr:CRISPR-associated helicase Cas3' [Pectinatus brassicae]MBB5337026.1 CRISPR-associated endonuclease/helicase Cas3 [Pectinatus brassicae]